MTFILIKWLKTCCVIRRMDTSGHNSHHYIFIFNYFMTTGLIQVKGLTEHFRYSTHITMGTT